MLASGPSDDLRSALEHAFRQVALPGLASAYLFGSHARGAPHRESDVDVGVVLRRDVYPDARIRFEVRLRLAGELGARVAPRTVDLVVLDDVPPLLGRHVITEGVRIYCADPASDHAFVRDVQLRAADLAPFLRRTARVKLAAIRR